MAKKIFTLDYPVSEIDAHKRYNVLRDYGPTRLGTDNMLQHPATTTQMSHNRHGVK